LNVKNEKEFEEVLAKVIEVNENINAGFA